RHVMDFGGGAAVHPDDAGRQRPALIIDGDAAVELAADADAGDVGWFRIGVAQGIGDGGAERRKPELRRLLDPARLREGRTIGAVALAAHAEGVVEDRDLEALRSD